MSRDIYQETKQANLLKFPPANIHTVQYLLADFTPADYKVSI